LNAIEKFVIILLHRALVSGLEMIVLIISQVKNILKVISKGRSDNSRPDPNALMLLNDKKP